MMERILDVLLRHRTEELNISTIAKLAKKDYKNTYVALEFLEEQGIVKSQAFGQAKRITLQPVLHPLLFEAEYNRRETALKNKDLRIVVNDFKNMKSKLFIMLLFGSHAKGTNTKHSDIDLFFIVPNADKEIKQEITATMSMHSLPLHINVFTESEFKAMYRSKELTVGQEIVKDNVILHNIEAYYALL